MVAMLEVVCGLKNPINEISWACGFFFFFFNDKSSLSYPSKLEDRKAVKASNDGQI